MNTLQRSILLILYLLVIYIFVHTYIYLENLNNCACFKTNPKYKVDIEFMKFFQILEIIIFTTYFLLMLTIGSLSKKIIKLQTNIIFKILTSISIGVLLFISAYMAYNVLNLYTNISSDCKCANEYYKYFVYYEGILSMSNIFRVFSMFITIFIIILFNNLH